MFNVIADLADFIVIDKSENINFHDEDDIGHGLFSQVRQYLIKHSSIDQLQIKQPALKQALPQNEENNAVELFPVHRLDKMTSGLIIFAKNLTTAQQFQRLFSQHSIEKYYLAMSDTKPKKKQGLIKGDMAKSRRGTWKLLRTMENPAVSQFFSYTVTTNTGKKNRLFIIKPHSGKTHQIRVALSSIGAAIIGDPSYNMQSVADRGYLHAFALRFELHGNKFQFISPPTQGEFFIEKEVTQKIATLKEPWLLPWPKI
jgi:tRNA pseudouridine32 synthase/23S rRNA pseudouridine746 synthase